MEEIKNNIIKEGKKSKGVEFILHYTKVELDVKFCEAFINTLKFEIGDEREKFLKDRFNGINGMFEYFKEIDEKILQPIVDPRMHQVLIKDLYDIDDFRDIIGIDLKEEEMLEIGEVLENNITLLSEKHQNIWYDDWNTRTDEDYAFIRSLYRTQFTIKSI